MHSIKTILNTGWSHGKYVDYWSFVHVLSGVILGIVATLFSDNHLLSFIIIFVLLVVYEGAEMLVKVSEGTANIVLDIIIGAVGSAFSIFILPQILSKQNTLGVLSLCILTNLFLVSLGWKNFLKHKSTENGSYLHVLYTLYFIYVAGTAVAIVSLLYWFG